MCCTGDGQNQMEHWCRSVSCVERVKRIVQMLLSLIAHGIRNRS